MCIFFIRQSLPSKDTTQANKHKNNIPIHFEVISIHVWYGWMNRDCLLLFHCHTNTHCIALKLQTANYHDYLSPEHHKYEQQKEKLGHNNGRSLL
jgi:hypothetical protein